MATIGLGVILLIIIWTISLLFLLVFCQAQGNIRLISVLPALLSVIITTIITTIPRGSNNKTTLPDYMYSNVPLIWILILVGLIIIFLVCLMLYLVTDIMEPRYAHVSKGLRVKH
jgi:hypothetical protein